MPSLYLTVPGRLLGVDKAGKCILGVYRKNSITLRLSPQFQEVSSIPPFTCHVQSDSWGVWIMLPRFVLLFQQERELTITETLWDQVNAQGCFWQPSDVWEKHGQSRLVVKVTLSLPPFSITLWTPNPLKPPIPVHVCAAPNTRQSGPVQTPVSQLLNPSGMSAHHRLLSAGLVTPMGSVGHSAVLIMQRKQTWLHFQASLDYLDGFHYLRLQGFRWKPRVEKFSVHFLGQTLQDTLSCRPLPHSAASAWGQSCPRHFSPLVYLAQCWVSTPCSWVHLFEYLLLSWWNFLERNRRVCH